VTTRTATGLWAPPDQMDQYQRVQRIGSALRAHWVAAKQVAASSPFFRRSANWLDASRQEYHHFTMGGRLIK